MQSYPKHAWGPTSELLVEVLPTETSMSRVEFEKRLADRLRVMQKMHPPESRLWREWNDRLGPGQQGRARDWGQLVETNQFQAILDEALKNDPMPVEPQLLDDLMEEFYPEPEMWLTSILARSRD